LRENLIFHLITVLNPQKKSIPPLRKTSTSLKLNPVPAPHQRHRACVSFPCKRESTLFKDLWIPSFEGMTCGVIVLCKSYDCPNKRVKLTSLPLHTPHQLCHIVAEHLLIRSRHAIFSRERIGIKLAAHHHFGFLPHLRHNGGVCHIFQK